MPASASPRLVGTRHAWPLHDTAGTRALERLALADAPEHALMQRAGLASARVALALAPHARSIWIAAGPGNNGGDGIEAALHLRQWGKDVIVTRLGDLQSAPADALAAYQRAREAGVDFADSPPLQWDLCIDALLGIGASRPPDAAMAQWISLMRAASAPVLAIDMPTGLNADTGVAAADCVRASATLCLLTLKPGLFTADGRDCSPQVWFDDLQVDVGTFASAVAPIARLVAAPAAAVRRHASHKGSYGDVAVVGGAPGMTGAALLAASAALHAGAGRTYLYALDERMPAAALDHPDLMLRDVRQFDPTGMTVVCGCGGGDLVRAYLPRLLSGAAKLVLDADALNALSADTQLQHLLRARATRNRPTVLTPHPLEAARLLGITSGQVQADRLDAVRRLALDYQCVVVLKGSGTVIAAPQRTTRINPTGNARLAIAGTGDVLAGIVGALLADGTPAFEAACQAVYRHGAVADHWPSGRTLTASRLAAATG